MKSILLFISFFLLSLGGVLCQECMTSYSGSSGQASSVNNSGCGNWKYYIPGYSEGDEDLSHHPVHTIRLSVSIVEDGNGGTWGNWTNDYTIDLNRVRTIFENWVSAGYRNLQPDDISNPSPTVEVWDSGIQFVVDSLYYAHSSTESINTSTSYAFSQEFYTLFAKKKSETINVFIGRHSQSGSRGAWVLSSFVDLFNMGWWGTDQTYATVQPSLIIHELGHALGLDHTNGSQDDIPDTPADPSNSNCVQPFSRNHMNQCQPNHWYFSPMQIGKMRMNIENNSQHVYNGTTSYETNFATDYTRFLTACDVQSSFPKEILADELWGKAMVLDRNIVIKSPNTLTVTCKVNMPKDGKIIVEPGAKLIVDGGILTNSRDDFWEGVQVWGDKFHHQYPLNHPTYQGKIELINGAVIENARNGIVNWNPDDWNSMGGVICASGATFRNNHKAIGFNGYQGTNPYTGVLLPDLSNLNYCVFIVNDSYHAPPEDFYSHVSMFKTDGVFFCQCQFLDERITKTATINSTGYGIASLDAAFAVVNSSFAGLNRAIWACTGDLDRGFKVDNCTFNNNVFGVHSNAVNFATITRNNFSIGANTVYNGYNGGAQFPDVGVFLNTGSSYCIEENNFGVSSNANMPSLGTYLENTGAADNEVYKNNYSGISYGNIAYGENKYSNGFSGLKYLCNQHTGNGLKNNIAVIGKPGISLFQAGAHPYALHLSAAGNTFTQSIAPEGDLLNVAEPIKYVHGCTLPPNCSTIPLYRTSNNVGLVFTNFTNSCPSHFGSSGNAFDIPLSIVNKNQLAEEHTAAENEFVSVFFTYNQLIDGGNTNSLISDIQSSWNDSVWALRERLLSYAPYLSESVLREVASTEALPLPMLLQVCLANPDAVKSEAFIAYVKDSIPNPFPEFMIDLILAVKDSITERTLLEESISRTSSLMQSASNIIIRDLRSDSLDRYQEIESWLNRIPTLSSQYELVQRRLEKANFSGGQQVLDSIPRQFTLTDREYAEYQNYSNLFSFLFDLNNKGRSVMQLDSNEIIALQAIAANSEFLSGTMADNILCFGYQICKEKVYPLPDEGSNQRKAAPKKYISRPTVAENRVTVFPNPTNSITLFTYEFYNVSGLVHLKIVDLKGSIMEDIKIETSKGIKEWNFAGFENGMYLFEFTNENKSLFRGKIVVNH